MWEAQLTREKHRLAILGSELSNYACACLSNWSKPGAWSADFRGSRGTNCLVGAPITYSYVEREKKKLKMKGAADGDMQEMAVVMRVIYAEIDARTNTESALRLKSKLCKVDTQKRSMLTNDQIFIPEQSIGFINVKIRSNRIGEMHLKRISSLCKATYMISEIVISR
ncbi:unnamed protein product [Albugo candida]|uniref:Uncharacterized protein n=1 Tax=Albugo candida TaxID=65357 RepID=A0A024FTR0_9STRA|nr:unnamed protein product [Albugo candida]|eukprot:CCI10513.1 unnamed protein product [Albugo candida]